ncbi:MAG: hypothetical protein DRR08_05050 [Candidatus Parabeggiatoa sp. nov. 2]|nr:MAG: hypothetical protein B6247_03765 [Beggiatoa sp. 4572_84]RKZ62827.1 MAG: hypothetical protein DRR08_05050 [Gammaproteobacteria bacterium]
MDATFAHYRDEKIDVKIGVKIGHQVGHLKKRHRLGADGAVIRQSSLTNSTVFYRENLGKSLKIFR